jgi:4-hydroxy 2-oxovalerate aldolase
MAGVKILDCTLRDGGYVNSWKFGEDLINKIVGSLTSSSIDIIEIGYLNDKAESDPSSVLFCTMDDVARIIPKNRGNSEFVVMADVNQVKYSDILPRNLNSGHPDGVRVVFYKQDIAKAFSFCKHIKDLGYKLFVQPMVTIDYTKSEYSELVHDFSSLNPDGVAIVDSFGMMGPEDFHFYYQILDEILPSTTAIGYHSHNNLDASVSVALDALKRRHSRQIILDSSMLGMGRGAGNLKTEITAKLYNETIKQKYDLIELVSNVYTKLEAIKSKNPWGPNVFYYLTASLGYHPNYAGYLLPKYPNLTVIQFTEFLKSVPEELKTNCKKDRVIRQFEALQKD